MVKSLGRISTLMAGALIVVSLGGCAIKHATANMVTGKQLFASNCGSCHTLIHANTTGSVGPNLDDAFRQDRVDGVKGTSIEGLVAYWIQYPNTQGAMPAMLVKGQDAQDVAAYVGGRRGRAGPGHRRARRRCGAEGQPDARRSARRSSPASALAGRATPCPPRARRARWDRI